MQRVQQDLGRVMTAEDGEGLGCVTKVFACAGTSKQGAPIDNRDLKAMTCEVVHGVQPGRSVSGR